MKVPPSPITGSSRTEHVARYEPCITSDGRIVEGVTDNWICRDSGLVFNAAGARGAEQAFYQDEYDLHSESAESEVKYFIGGKTVGLYDMIVDFIADGIPSAPRGRALDIGCGKGLLLKRFSAQRPAWKLSAVEPSRNAKVFFARIMPDLAVHEGSFETSPFAAETFNLVIANGVLEHVPNPADFLRRFRACIAEDGCGFLGIPNFDNNPADLFTFDHLSRFTPRTAEALFAHVGLEVVHAKVESTRVAMWYVVRRVEPAAPSAPDELFARERETLGAALGYVAASFRACDAAKAASSNDGSKIAMYGTGAIGYVAMRHTTLTTADVAAVYDDNPTFWGTERCGIPIRPPAELAQSGARHVVISANPPYLQAIRARIRELVGPAVVIHSA